MNVKINVYTKIRVLHVHVFFFVFEQTCCMHLHNQLNSISNTMRTIQINVNFGNMSLNSS